MLATVLILIGVAIVLAIVICYFLIKYFVGTSDDEYLKDREERKKKMISTLNFKDENEKQFFINKFDENTLEKLNTKNKFRAMGIF